MEIKQPPFYRLTWLSLLFFGASSKGLTDPCAEELSINELGIQWPQNKIKYDIKDTDFKCLLYPTNLLNCSWSFQYLEKEAEVSVITRICHDIKTLETQVSKGKEGSSKSLIQRHEDLYVLMHFNISLRDQLTVYFYRYDAVLIEVLSPPANITASFTDSGLLVTWDPPRCQTCAPHCLEYNLCLGDQTRHIVWKENLSHTEPNVDLSRSYTVRLRTRVESNCAGLHHWSDWSQPVTIQARHSTFKLNPVVIVAISLGIPMILLALVLLLRYQWYCLISQVFIQNVESIVPKLTTKCMKKRSERSVPPTKHSDFLERGLSKVYDVQEVETKKSSRCVTNHIFLSIRTWCSLGCFLCSHTLFGWDFKLVSCCENGRH